LKESSDGDYDSSMHMAPDWGAEGVSTMFKVSLYPGNMQEGWL